MLIGIYSQLQEVTIQWSVQVVTSVARVPPCAQRPSASLGLHVPPWTREASILGGRIIALSPPFPSPCRASRPGAPAAPATLRLGSCTEHFPGEKVSIQAAAQTIRREDHCCPGVVCNLSWGNALVEPTKTYARWLALNLKLWME